MREQQRVVELLRVGEFRFLLNLCVYARVSICTCNVYIHVKGVSECACAFLFSLSRSFPPFLPPSLPACLPPGPHGRTKSGGRVLAVNTNTGARAPRGGVTRQGVVLTDLQSLLDCQ